MPIIFFTPACAPWARLYLYLLVPGRVGTDDMPTKALSDRLAVALLIFSWLFASGVARAAEEPPLLPSVLPWGTDGLVSLEIPWQFRPGDNPVWALVDYDESAWESRDLKALWPRGGYPQTGQMAWYRLRLQFSPRQLADMGDHGRLAISAGKVMSAYELYAGGQLLGGVGTLPPFVEVQYDKFRVYPIPASAVEADGTLVLALRVWGGENAAVDAWGAGPFDGSFALGDYRTLLMSAIVTETPGMLFSAFFIGFGIYHLYLYWRNRQLRPYLWFGLMAINIGIYGLMLSQWKYVLDWQFITFKKLEYGTIYLFPALGLQMIWSMFKEPVSRAMRAYQLIFVVFAALVVIVPGLGIHYQTLGIWQLCTLPALVLGPWLLIRKMREGDREARTLLLGAGVFVATCVNDLMIDWVPLQTPHLIHYGFVAVMLAMAVSLANSFTAMLNQLEAEVEQRTNELRAVNRHLSVAARNDPLTGLLNRRGFTEEAMAEIQRGYRSGRSFAVVLADVDKFKKFNDRYGHACGDRVLRRVAELLRERVREIDFVARWGGEEFILMLPEADLEGAAILAEHLRGSIESSTFDFDGRQLSITMTFGIAVYRKGETLEGCIDRADSALYEGKERGRNKVMVGNYKGLTLVT